MKNYFKTLKEKQLAKKLSGIALGTVAALSFATPTYASNELSGGQVDSGDYIGTAPKHEVNIVASGGNASLTDVSGIYGMADYTSSSQVVTGSVLATGLDLDMGGVKIQGGLGYNNVGQGNKVSLINGKYTNLEGVVGYVDAANNGKNITAADNTVILHGATVKNDVDGVLLGGGLDTDIANNVTTSITTVTLKDGNIGGAVNGAYILRSKYATVEQTTLDLNGGGTVRAFGARIKAEDSESEGKATKTNVKLEDVNVNLSVDGVDISAKKSATADETTLEIKGGKIFSAYGARINVDGTEGVAEATKTTVKLSGNITPVSNLSSFSVHGAWVEATKSATADQTTVSIDNITGKSDVYGVWIESKEFATAKNTTIDIKGGNLGLGGATGAYIKAYGTEGVAEAKDTIVTLEGVNAEGSVISAEGVDIEAKKSATVKNTTLNIKGGTIDGATGVNFNDCHTGTEITAEKTKLLLDGVTTPDKRSGTVIGVDAMYKVKKADISGTEIEITGGDIKTDVYGIYFLEYTADHTHTDEVTIKDTTLTLKNGAMLDRDITAVRAGASKYLKTENTQIIFDGTASKVKGTVAGVNLFGSATTKSSSGTALTIKNIGNEVGNIKNFDVINFVLPNGVKDGDILLKVTGSYVPGSYYTSYGDTDLRQTIIKTTSAVDATDTKLKDGDKIYLITKGYGGDLLLKDDKAPSDEVLIVQNAVTTKKGTYEFDGKKNLWINVSVGDTPQNAEDNKKSLTETIAGSVALLNSGADFMTEQAMGEAKLAAKEGSVEGTGSMTPFVAFGGRSMKYKSGSSIDAKGWNAALGFAKEQGELTYGVAIEHGQANYDSYVNAAHGEGKNKYTGGVIFAEMKKASGAHFDASFRAGKAKSDYSANLSVLGVPTPTSYDTSSTYLGFSLGIGKEQKMGEAGALDIYARYYFNHLGGSNVTTNSGVDIDFKASDSSRLRLGTRYTQKMNEKNKLYAGLAWQYEFAGKAKAVINGTDAPSPSLKGHSAMAELGWKAEAGKNFTIDLGVNGWLGKQRGIAGNLGFKWTF